MESAKASKGQEKNVLFRHKATSKFLVPCCNCETQCWREANKTVGINTSVSTKITKTTAEITKLQTDKSIHKQYNSDYWETLRKQIKMQNK